MHHGCMYVCINKCIQTGARRITRQARRQATGKQMPCRRVSGAPAHPYHGVVCRPAGISVTVAELGPRRCHAASKMPRVGDLVGLESSIVFSFRLSQLAQGRQRAAQVEVRHGSAYTRVLSSSIHPRTQPDNPTTNTCSQSHRRPNYTNTKSKGTNRNFTSFNKILFTSIASSSVCNFCKLYMNTQLVSIFLILLKMIKPNDLL